MRTHEHGWVVVWLWIVRDGAGPPPGGVHVRTPHHHHT